MTTSHRPQIGARNGAKGSYVPTNIQHARLLPGHTKLKYRKRKLETSEEEEDERAEKVRSTGEKRDVESKVGEDEVIQKTGGGESGDEGEEEEDEEEDEEEEDDEEDDEDEEDQEALLRELNAIRQERMVQKLKKERDELEHSEKDTPTPSVQRSWRSQTVFGRQRKTPADQPLDSRDPKNDYTNDMTKSKFHNDFLRKYVR